MILTIVLMISAVVTTGRLSPVSSEAGAKVLTGATLGSKVGINTGNDRSSVTSLEKDGRSEPPVSLNSHQLELAPKAMTPITKLPTIKAELTTKRDFIRELEVESHSGSIPR